MERCRPLHRVCCSAGVPRHRVTPHASTSPAPRSSHLRTRTPQQAPVFPPQGSRLVFLSREARHRSQITRCSSSSFYSAFVWKPRGFAALAPQPGRRRLRRSHLPALPGPSLVPRTASPRGSQQIRNRGAGPARCQPSSSPGAGELLPLLAPARASHETQR